MLIRAVEEVAVKGGETEGENRYGLCVNDHVCEF